MAKPAKVTSAMVDEWIQRYKAGESTAQIASTSCVNAESVRHHLIKAGIRLRKPGAKSKLSSVQESEIIAAYKRGASIGAVARLANVSSSAVRSCLLRHNCPIRTAGETRSSQAKRYESEWILAYSNGESAVSIGNRYGYSSTTVYKYLNEAGVKPRVKLDDRAAKEIVSRYLNGSEIQQLAHEFRVSDTSIRNLLKRNNVQIRKPSRGYRIDESLLNEWELRYKSGESLGSIASSANIKSPDVVRDRLTARGVQIRDKIGPHCSSSWPEWAIYYYLDKAFPGSDIENNRGINTERGVVFPDITLLNKSLLQKQGVIGFAVEYDGEHWHNSVSQRSIDKRKSELLRKAGFHVIRIIENSSGINEKKSDSIVLCTQERTDDCKTGLAFAIVTILGIMGAREIDVDLERDSGDITRLFSEARSRLDSLAWLEMYNRGVSSNEIAKLYGTTPTTVTSHLKQLGVSIRHRPKTVGEQELWRDEYLSGLEVPEIAKRHDIEKSLIYRYLKEQGISFSEHRVTETDLEWKELYERGQSLNEIAQLYHVSIGKVRAHLVRQGITIRNKPLPVITAKDIDRWKTAYLSGDSISEIARKNELGESTIRNNLVKAGIQPNRKPHNKLPIEIERRILTLHKNGRPAAEIAATVGVVKSTVYRVLKRNPL